MVKYFTNLVNPANVESQHVCSQPSLGGTYSHVRPSGGGQGWYNNGEAVVRAEVGRYSQVGPGQLFLLCDMLRLSDLLLFYLLHL